MPNVRLVNKTKPSLFPIAFQKFSAKKQSQQSTEKYAVTMQASLLQLADIKSLQQERREWLWMLRNRDEFLCLEM